MTNNFSKGTPWAILPTHYETLAERYKVMISDPEMSKEAATKFNNKTGKFELEIIDGVAAIDIIGPIHNRSSFFSFFYGGAVISRIEKELSMAEDDWRVKSILLNFDSPGGTIAGVDDLSSRIKIIQKPVIAYTGGMMCSAAMWVGSAADKIIVSKTAEVGSIGVLMIHEDYSKMDKEMGIETTVLKAGKYKSLGNPYEPLSGLGKDTFQAELDYLYSLFVETISKNKNTSIENVLKMADGKVFIGQQAKDIGLVDQVGTFKDAFKLALSIGGSEIKYFLLTGKKKEKIMSKPELNSIKELKAAFPDLVAEILKEGKESVDTSGLIKAETGRILELAKAHFGEDGDKFEALSNSGVTLNQYKAMQELQPKQSSEDDIKAKILAELEKDQVGDPGTDGDGAIPKDFTAAWKAIKAEEKCSSKKAMSKAAKKYPELYEKHASGGK